MVKVRTFPEHNYKGIYSAGKTIRVAIDPSKPITELDYPEFYDVKITDTCNGNCPYCYMDSTASAEPYENVIPKLYKFFGPMTDNQKPFQVAIGGGEPTMSPDFEMVLHTLNSFRITPNYTTNGMFMADGIDRITKIMSITRACCGGVAISCHPHLNKYWMKALVAFSRAGIKTNLHIVISDKESIDWFRELYDVYSVGCGVDYFVLLPHYNQGRAEEKHIDWEYLVTVMPEDASKIAFGANFYPYLKGNPNLYNISLYEPEIMSKFLDLKDMKLYPSSFHREV